MPSNLNALFPCLKKEVRSTEKRLIVDNIFTRRILRTYCDSFQALLLPLNVFFFCQFLYSATFIHSQSRMIKITFCSLSFRSMLISLILVTLWFILPYSVVIPPRSGIFRYHSCLFRLIPVSFGFIPESILLVPAYSGLFRYMLLYLCVIPPHSAVILGCFGIFRHHSCSFSLIPVSFRLIPAYSGMCRFICVSFRLIVAYSGLFWYIPFRSCV